MKKPTYTREAEMEKEQYKAAVISLVKTCDNLKALLVVYSILKNLHK